jgi:ABC-type cobalamin/Fe3+-siderophores transport system ATPase subunit
MKMLRDRIKERNSTALIVSHDIALSLEFADRIILMTKETSGDGEMHGAIRKENQYVKQVDGAWKADARRMTRFEFHQFLEKHFENN